LLLAVICLAQVLGVASACADEYDIIIEKNLFHDQRQKWEMEKPQSKGDASPGGAEGKNIDQIKLFGTVVRDANSYAVMRVAKPSASRTPPRGRPSKEEQGGDQKQDDKRPYAIGDFIGGYRLVEIKPASVLLQDTSSKSRYEIFMNQGETERSAVKTEIAEEKPQPEQPPPAPGGRRPSPNPQPAPEGGANPAQSADFMRQRFQRNMQQLRENPNDAALQQAERDWEKLQPLMPSIEESGREDLMRLREEFERMRQP
jgi:hypothetical protein